MEELKKYEWIEWCGCYNCAGHNDDCGYRDDCVTSKKVKVTD